MSISNAPKKWNEINAAAKACGASEWARRKWLSRCEIPAAWKLKIHGFSRGKISFSDMEMKPAEVEAAQ